MDYKNLQREHNQCILGMRKKKAQKKEEKKGQNTLDSAITQTTN